MRELSLNILDVAQNSVRAEASLTEITVTEDQAGDSLVIEIRDNGKGMTQEQIEHVVDPFFTTRTTRKVGLGVPLFKMAAEQTGGSLRIESQTGAGTVVTARFHPSHVDMTPLGDINATVSLLIRCNPALDFCFTHRVNGREFTLDTRQLREILGGVPLDSPDVMEWIEGYLKEQTELIYGGASPDEVIG